MKRIPTEVDLRKQCPYCGNEKLRVIHPQGDKTVGLCVCLDPLCKEHWHYVERSSHVGVK